jgi:hypothetical protein
MAVVVWGFSGSLATVVRIDSAFVLLNVKGGVWFVSSLVQAVTLHPPSLELANSHTHHHHTTAKNAFY